MVAFVLVEKVLAGFDFETQSLIRTKINMGVSLITIGNEFGIAPRLLRRLAPCRVEPRSPRASAMGPIPDAHAPESKSLNNTAHGGAERARREDLAQRVALVLKKSGLPPVAPSKRIDVSALKTTEPLPLRQRGNNGFFITPRRLRRDKIPTIDSPPEGED